MSRKIILTIVLAAVGAGLITLLGGAMSDRSAAQKEQAAELWKKVKEADGQGLPQSAIESLKKIESLAREGRLTGDFLRAVSRRLILESVVEGNKPEVRISGLREEIGRAPEAARPVMKLILAQWYWHYYERNRWRFMNRTAVAGGNDKDFTTWDLPRLYREIDRLYQDVLLDETGLKKIPLAAYADFLDAGDPPSGLRPTLFDFTAYEALEFYTSAEQAAIKSEDAFFIASDSPALEAAEAFVAWRPQTTDAESAKIRAITLFQKLLAFHRGAAGRDAFIDADLHRLRYVRAQASGEGVADRHRKRLSEIVESRSGSDLASQAAYELADSLFDEGRYVEAHAAARRGETLHPKSIGAANCRSLLARIQAKDYSVRSESVHRPGGPGKIAVQYRNITELHFRVIAEDFGRLLGSPEAETIFWFNDDDALRALKSRPAAAWSVSLDPTPDFKLRTVLTDLPALKPGFYRILVSGRKDFAPEVNKIASASFWVSELGLVDRALNGEFQGLVVRGDSGEPVAGADVVMYEWQHDGSRLARLAAGRTDAQGFFNLGARDPYGNRLIHVRTGAGGEIAESQVVSNSRPGWNAFERTILFTDRAIYRPGQMIHFKGICLSSDREHDGYKLLTKRPVHVSFRDANRQEVGALDLVTNAYGSFSGTFHASADRLTGAWNIMVESPGGAATVRIEEYKRPKFQVKVEIPDREFRLNETVAVPGEALAYTGAPIDGAQVRYRVVREVQYPWWWYYWYPEGRRGGAQEIAHGAARTDEAGKFKIEFPARPDPSAKPADRPVFTFSVFADVTDTAGETRSGLARIRLGFTSMEAGLSAAELQDASRPAALNVVTATLNGKRVAAQGTIEVRRLKEPAEPVPADLFGETASGAGNTPAGPARTSAPRTSEWKIWADGETVQKAPFQTSREEDKPCRVEFPLKAGAYRAVLKTKDAAGADVEAQAVFLVVDRAAGTFAAKIPFFSAANPTVVDVGTDFELLWGTGYSRGPVFVEILQEGRVLRREWTDPSRTQGLVRLPVAEKLRGGFLVHVGMVKANRYYHSENRVFVPWSNKQLNLSWGTFRSKLQPGQAETWTVRVQGPKATIQAAEMVATLYDVSLDQFVGHGFQGLGWIFRTDSTALSLQYVDRRVDFRSVRDSWNVIPGASGRTYVRFPSDIEVDRYFYAYAPMPSAAPPGVERGAVKAMAPARDGQMLKEDVADAKGSSGVTAPAETRPDEGGKTGPDLGRVQARKALDETAFFFPHLTTGPDGTVTISFKMPEALTEWRFLGLAHTQGLASGSIEGRAVTQKDLMVQPNPPRFLREGDVLEFTVKVTNMSAAAAAGAVELRFFDPRTNTSLDAALDNKTVKLPFSIPAKQSRSFSWPLRVADGLEVVGFKAAAATAGFSDGEEAVLPVLSRRLLVRESIPLWISAKGEKTFLFDKLIKSAASDSLRHQGLTVQMASNPAWYAVQALPFLMEFPYECSEQVFNRLYANALAKKIADGDPKIRRIFDLWKGTPALDSNLEKNQDLKSVLLQESPWVLEAKAESQAKRNVGLLFDANRMSAEIRSAVSKLQAMQLGDGSWPWFPGGPGNSYITLYIVTGFGRLKAMGVSSVPQDMARKALGHLDGWIDEIYRDILRRGDKALNNLSSTIALYLYSRSFYLAEAPVPKTAREAVDYFLKQAAKHWLDLGWRQSQGHLALGLARFGDKATAQAIMRSMKERSRYDEEMGRFWREMELSWWWYRAPIETQAVMIEAFDEVMGDAQAVEECKIWLLKQKQTQDWKTTKATADAVYALLRRGADWLASDALVEVRLGGRPVKPERVEAGTGFYEKRFAPSEIVPDMGRVTVIKSDPGIAWGGLHWQYLEDVSKITPHEQNPLKLKKDVFVRKATGRGPVLEPVAGPLAVGDTLVVRVELRTDRDMEYVHMKDHRGSGLEPVNVLSLYKYQDGLVYYEATKDTATHFFIDYLPKGTYVFEYPLKVVHRGSYQTGLAHIECMYAPEFNSHSGSVKLEVR